MLLTSPVWLVGSLMLLARGAVRGVFVPTWQGFVAAFAGLGPMLATRRALKARRKVSPTRIAAAFTWNPFRYLGRSIDVRPFPSDQSVIRNTSANARNT